MQNFFKMQPDNRTYTSATNDTNTLLIRDDIVGELQAINQYQRHIMETNNQLVKQTLTSIKMEEEVHVGELMGLLFSIDNEARTQFEKGLAEFENMAKK